MPRSVRDSDDDFEPKAGSYVAGRMQTRMLSVQPVSSPLRRSSRIKQTKYSPGSESDSSSISNSQTIRSTRARTATMDSTVSDTMKKLRTRKPSISSDISEIDGDILLTPGKRTTRQSLGALVGTPTRVNTRAASKRLMRAVSETQSPLPAARTMRKTRASSVEPESLFDQNKSRSDSPIKTRKRASMLPSSSLAKEQIELEDRIPYVRLDATIVEADEITSSGNSDSSPDKASRLPRSQKIEKRQSISKDQVNEDDSHEKMETSTDSSKDETLQSLKRKDETQAEDMDTEDTHAEGQYKLEKTPPDNGKNVEVSTYSSSSSGRRDSVKEDKTIILEDSLSDVEKSLIDICESSKVSENVSGNSLDTSTEEEKSNKENEMLNINSDVSVEKSMQLNVKSPCSKPLVSPFMNKSLDEKETKSLKELSKRRRSRESTEISIKHDDLSKEAADNSQEKMNISIESLNSTATNKTVLSQHGGTKLVDKFINKDKTSTDNINTSTSEDTMEVTSQSDKIDKKEYAVIDNKNSNKIESDKLDKTSRLSTSPAKSTQIENRNDNRESLTSILSTDDNEMKLTLEERSPRRDKIEVPSNVAHADQTEDLQISSPINESSNDRTTVTQDKVIESSDSTEEKQEQENLFKCVTELTPKSSNTTLETNNSSRDDLNDVVIQDDQSSVIIETSKKPRMDISSEKTDTEDILSEEIMKRNSKRKSKDVLDDLEREKGNSQIKTSQKDQENIEITDDGSDIEGIDLFQDIPAEKWKKKNDVSKTDSVQSTAQSVGKVENDNKAECDLILVNRRAWLAAETIKAAKEAEPFEYDSDDTVLLKSRLDAAQASYNIKKLDIVDEELDDVLPPTDVDIDSEENEKRVVKQKSRTQKRLTSEIDLDSSRCTEDEDNIVTTDKSFNESKIALNRTNDRSISRLNKSKQLTRTKRRSSKASDESDKEIENDASKLNRSWLISNKNTSLRKSVGGRTSLNKSSKDTSMQNVSANKSRIDDSEEEFDQIDTHAEKKLYKRKRSLNKSRNEDADNDATESEKNNVSTGDISKKDKNTSSNCSMDQESKLIETKTMIHLNDDESDNSDINIAATDRGSKTYSMIANAGSIISDQDERDIPSYLFAKANSDNDTEDSSSDSDINREYNLDGVEQKFSDDDVPADECRTSEVELSDSDDNGSDLADFIVDDDDVEDKKQEEDDEVEMHDIKDDESENEKNVEEDESCEDEVKDEEDKQAHIDTGPINTEDENEEDDEDIQEEDYAADEEDAKENNFAGIEAISSYASTSKLSKIHKSENKSMKYISPRKSDTKMKQDVKMKKSSMEKNEKIILLDSSNSDLSIKKKKKKSLVKENATNLSSSSIKKPRKLDPQYSSRDEAEQDSSEQLSEYEFFSAKKLPKSRELMKFSTPNDNSCKKLEPNKIFERISENKDIKSDNTIKPTQNTLVEKGKSKKNLNEDINFKRCACGKTGTILNTKFSPDLLKLREKINLPKLTSSKIELNKTIHIVDTETPTIKHLRKEKLNESAPTLQSNAETSSLSTKKKDIAQIKLKKKNNKDEVPDLIILSSGDAVQKHSQKKQKHKKRDTSKENIINEALSEDAIESDVPKKKKHVKLTQLTTVDDNIHEDACQISEKKKKKQDTSKENITDKALSEDVVELKILKKKKPVKFTQLTIVDDNIREDACQISEKKKKKKQQDTSRENIEAVSEGAIELKIPKKKKPIKLTQLTITDEDIHEDASISEKGKKKKKKKQDTEENVDEALFEDTAELKIPKKKKRTKLIQLPTVEDNTRGDICKINEREKKKKRKRETLKEYITEKSLSGDSVELKIPKKKRAKFSQLAIMDDNTYEDACQMNEKGKKKKKKINVEDENLNEDNTCKNAYQINEKEKKKKKRAMLKKNITEKALYEDAAELKILTKKKRANLDQLAIVQDNTREDAYQINEKGKKKKNKQINVVEEDENVNEGNILRKNIRENKTGLAQQKKKNKIVSSLKLGLPTDKHMLKKKTKQQKTVESIETLWMEKNTLPVQIPVSKIKSDKNILSRKLLQNTLDASESKNVAYTTKKLDKAAAKICIPKELKPKKKRDRTEDIENAIRGNAPTKMSKKEIKEMTKFLPSSSGIKRLSDDVIENLTDVPTRAKKRRKILRNEEQAASSVKTGKSKVPTADDSLIASSTSGCSTQFYVVNLQNTKKQPPTGAAAAASFRQRMLARNNREPMSAYMIYRDKMNIK